jgi:dienelactone hydrolase
MARWTVPEWRATVEALQKLDHVVNGPIGYWGMSMGGAVGVRLAAAEPRITACVVDLVGSALTVSASRVTAPLMFLTQWDDGAVPRDEALALFHAFASPEKTLHANPGPHGQAPRFEVDSTVSFFARHLKI